MQFGFLLRPVVLASAAASFLTPVVAQAQPPAPGGLVSPMPVPDQLELSKLIWNTVAAVDHANLAGNYSVLRDLSAPGFQANNDSARLAEIFATVRQSRIDLSNALLLAPTYSSPPEMIAPDMLRVQGMFGLRPTAITFDLRYQWVAGRWRLFGIAIGSTSIGTDQGPPRVLPQPSPPRSPGR